MERITSSWSFEKGLIAFFFIGLILFSGCIEDQASVNYKYNPRDLNYFVDVNYNSPDVNEVLLWNGSEWVNGDGNIVSYDVNQTVNGAFYFPGSQITFDDTNHISADLNGVVTGETLDANINFVFDSRMPISDQNLFLPTVWSAIDGNSGGSGAFYYAGSNMTLSDSNYFNADLNGVMNQATFDSNFNASTYGSADFNATYLNSFADVNASDVNISQLNNPTWTNQSHYNNLFGSAGRATGGVISDAGGETINVTAGTGFIKNIDDDTAELFSFDWDANNGIAIPTNSTRFIGVIRNGGNPVVDSRIAQDWDYDTEFPLGSVINLNGTLYILNNPWWITDGMTNVIEKTTGIAGYLSRDEWVGGLILGVTGTRNPTMTAGTVWGRLTEFEMSAIDYSTPTGTFNTYWFDLNGAVHETTGLTQYPITEWNDVDNNTLDTIGNNQYANWWVFLNVTNNELAFMYPQATYSNSASAEAEEIPNNIPHDWYLEGLIIGRILFKQGVDSPVQVQSVFTTQFTPAQATDHGNLGGLSDDDHPQYVLWTDGNATYVKILDLNTYLSNYTYGSSDFNTTYLNTGGENDTNTVTAGWTDNAGEWQIDLNTTNNLNVDGNTNLNFDVNMSNGSDWLKFKSYPMNLSGFGLGIVTLPVIEPSVNGLGVKGVGIDGGLGLINVDNSENGFALLTLNTDLNIISSAELFYDATNIADTFVTLNSDLKLYNSDTLDYYDFNAGNATIDSNLSIGEYMIGDTKTGSLLTQSTTSGMPLVYGFLTKDADGTDEVSQYIIGKFGDDGNIHALSLGYDPADERYNIYTVNAGQETNKALAVGTSAGNGFVFDENGHIEVSAWDDANTGNQNITSWNFVVDQNSEGDASYIGNFFNVTDLNHGSGAHLLAQWAKGGVSRFDIDADDGKLRAGWMELDILNTGSANIGINADSDLMTLEVNKIKFNADLNVDGDIRGTDIYASGDLRVAGGDSYIIDATAPELKFNSDASTTVGQIQYLNAANTLSYYVGGTAAANKVGSFTAAGFQIGGGADTDYSLSFNANSNDGLIQWYEDEDYFIIPDTINLTGTYTGVGTNLPKTKLYVTNRGNLNYQPTTFSANTVAAFVRSYTTGDNSELTILAGNVANAILNFGQQSDEDQGYIDYDHSDNTMNFGTADSTRAVLSDQGLKIGASTEAIYQLDVVEDATQWAAYIFNDGDNANRLGLGIQAGADDAAGDNFILGAYDGDGTFEGGLIIDDGVFELYDVSDENKKQNIVDSNSSETLEKIKNLRIVDFEYIDTPESTHTGMLAQDLNTYYPDSVISTSERTKQRNFIVEIDSDTEVTSEEVETIQSEYLEESLTLITEDVNNHLGETEQIIREVSLFTDTRNGKEYYSPDDWFNDNYEIRNEKITEEGFIGISRTSLIPELFKAIKELVKEKEEQQVEIDLLKSELCKKDNTYAWCKK